MVAMEILLLCNENYFRLICVASIDSKIAVKFEHLIDFIICLEINSEGFFFHIIKKVLCVRYFSFFTIHILYQLMDNGK